MNQSLNNSFVHWPKYNVGLMRGILYFERITSVLIVLIHYLFSVLVLLLLFSSSYFVSVL
jgi:hypothetical protein